LKKVENFDHEIVTVNQPAFTSLSPQTHHKNTTLKHRNFSKTPAKTPLHHTGKKLRILIRDPNLHRS
jgi:hypothetical protein